MIKHIAYIMDGNRRYSQEKKLNIESAYKIGMEQFLKFIKYQIKYDIFETSFFALSIDNYNKRPTKEKIAILNLLKEFYSNKEFKGFFLENQIRINLLGNIDELEEKLQKETFFISKENLIKNLKLEFDEINSQVVTPKFKVNLALNYDGQEEILNSFKNIFKKIKSGEIDENQINIDLIKENLYTNNSPPPEIIVRPGNAPRTSGFLLWDSKYSEIFFSKKLWPELNENDFLEILHWFEKQKRNFGQ